MKKVLLIIILAGFVACIQAQGKHRLIVLTDIENDPDDKQSLVRLLLYSNHIDIEGLIATTSVHQQEMVAPESIREIVEAYGEVRRNLLKHESGFPTSSELLKVVSQGVPLCGIKGIGEGKDSEGSELIIKALEKDDGRPLWVTAWGGPNTLAQALWKIHKTKSKKEVDRLINKLRVYTISDQDDSGSWMRQKFPNLFYIVSPGSYYSSTWVAINELAPGIDNETMSNDWLAENIQQNHGALGAVYPDCAFGMEGDTPSWLNLILNGLGDPEHPDWGGWGGRYELYQPPYKKTGWIVPVVPETRPIWTNAVDTYTPYIHKKYSRAIGKDTVTITSNKATIWRWRDDFQNDFAARMDWCTKSYEEANHPPVPSLGHPEMFSVKSGEIFTLNAKGTKDPDGDSMSYLWFQYQEASSYKEPVKTKSSGNPENMDKFRNLIAPDVDKPETIHFILKVTDKGTPALTRYKRVIVTINPK